MILAGDVGGTKTLIGLFEVYKRRPVPVDVRTFQTTAYPGLPAIISEFFAAQAVRPELTAAAFGVAGPVINQSAKMTNVPWAVDAAEIARVFHLPRVQLLNDLESMAYSLPVLLPDELKTLQSGTDHTEGTVALIAAGTGLGQALLHHVGDREFAIPSEGDHSDFAARTEREMAFAQFLRERYGRSEIEHVLSGPGLVNLYNTLAALDRVPAAPYTAAQITDPEIGAGDRLCREATDMFCAMLGTVAGNLVLTLGAQGGVYIAGGIVPRLGQRFAQSGFRQRFEAKGRMQSYLAAVPAYVVTHKLPACLGCAAALATG